MNAIEHILVDVFVATGDEYFAFNLELILFALFLFLNLFAIKLRLVFTLHV